MWHELDRDQHSITEGMNTPHGVIVRVSLAVDSRNFQIIHLENVKVENNKLVNVIPHILPFPSHGIQLYHDTGQYHPAQFTAQSE